MSTAERNKTLTEARKLEQSGDFQGAIRGYIRAGHALDASRVLANLGKFGEAGDLLLNALRLSPDNMGTLQGARRNAAIKAAICFSRAGRFEDAVTIALALNARLEIIGTLLEVGEHDTARKILGSLNRPDLPPILLEEAARERARSLSEVGQLEEAAQLFTLAGEHEPAARALWTLGRQEEAVDILIKAELWLQAAQCLTQAGEPEGALHCLDQITDGQPTFRQACVALIGLIHSEDLNPSDHQSKLVTWVKTAPINLAELQAMYLLGLCYERIGNASAALSLYERVEDKRPGHGDVSKRIKRLRTPDRPSRSEVVVTPVAKHKKPAQAASNRRDKRQEAPVVSFSMGKRKKGGPLKLNPTKPPRQAAKGPEFNPMGATVDSVAESKASMGTMSSTMEPGTLVDSRYEVQLFLGEGATAAVYQAHDNDLGDPIAIKFFHMSVSRNEIMAERMKLEIKLCRKLAHQNIIRIFDIGTFAGHRYLTMELLEGKTLQQRLQDGLTLSESLDYLIQACAGLDEAHRAGFVHRDVKPDNLFVTHDKVLKVMDFGIAKQTTSQGMTLTGTILGTPGFMAPEQIDGSSSVTQAADQYALGSVAYRMLTGSMVFTHKEMMPLLMMHVTETPELPSTRQPRLTAEFDAVLMRMLSKNPADRYASCAEAGEALATLRRQL